MNHLIQVFRLTHYRRQILDAFKLKEFADHNFKFDENGRKLSKRVENTVGKEKLLLFLQCFQKACFQGASKGVIVWEWVKKSVKSGWGNSDLKRGLLEKWRYFQWFSMVKNFTLT